MVDLEVQSVRKSVCGVGIGMEIGMGIGLGMTGVMKKRRFEEKKENTCGFEETMGLMNSLLVELDKHCLKAKCIKNNRRNAY